MFCTKCGTALTGEINFCTACGTKAERTLDKGAATGPRKRVQVTCVLCKHIFTVTGETTLTTCPECGATGWWLRCRGCHKIVGIWSKTGDWTFTCPLCGARQTPSTSALALARFNHFTGSVWFILILGAVSLGLLIFHQPLTNWLSSLGNQTAPSNLSSSSKAGGASKRSVNSYCLIQPDGSNGEWSIYHRVNTESAAPCYSHFNMSPSNGPGCGMWVNGRGPFAAALNVWNVTSWGEASNNNGRSMIIALLQDGTSLTYTCSGIAENAPQTTLISQDYS